MVTERPGDRRGVRWWRSRARMERRLIVLVAAAVLVVAVPGLRAAVVELALGVVAMAVVLGLVGLLSLVIAWRVVRRHPVGDLLLGAWLLRRHERRQQRSVDARSWHVARQPYEARSWETGTRKRGW